MKYSIYLFAILFLTISLSVQAQQRFSVAGRIIENIDFSYISNGLYFLKVDNNTIKLIKQ